MFYPHDIKKWNIGTLQSAIQDLGRVQLNSSGQMALCSYLGAVDREEIENAIAIKCRIQGVFDSAQKASCMATRDPKPTECLRFRLKLEEFIKK